MQLNILSRLESLHAAFSQLRDANSAPLKAKHFDANLNELAALAGEVRKLQATQQLLNDLSGAMSVLLELLHCSDDHKLRGCQLHCLLLPFQEKLDQAMEGVEMML